MDMRIIKAEWIDQARQKQKRILFFQKNALKSLEARKKALSLQPHLEKCTFKKVFAAIAQLVEHDLAKVGVASSSLVCRSTT